MSPTSYICIILSLWHMEKVQGINYSSKLYKPLVTFIIIIIFKFNRKTTTPRERGLLETVLVTRIMVR